MRSSLSQGLTRPHIRLREKDLEYLSSQKARPCNSLKFEAMFIICQKLAILSDPESILSSDTCPETPDGSLKEEVDCPDTGTYLCLWDCCNQEFESQKLFVDHLNEAHTETKKGCDEFPCLWKVKNKGYF